MVDIFQTLDEEWDESEEAEPHGDSGETEHSTCQPRQEPSMVLQNCHHLLVRTHNNRMQRERGRERDKKGEREGERERERERERGGERERGRERGRE